MSKKQRTQLGMPVVYSEPYTMPNGMKAEIRVHHGKGGYGAMLWVGRNSLPLSTGHCDTAVECAENAKRFLGKPIYGRN